MYKIRFCTGNLIFESEISEKGIFSLTALRLTDHNNGCNILKTCGRADATIAHYRDKLIYCLNEYMSKNTDLRGIETDLSGYTPSEISIFKSLMDVPAGDVVSYSELASYALRNHANRYVGRVLSRNRIQIIVPCHRVVRKDLKIGGFTSSLGLKLKYFLLHKEGIIIEGNKIRHARFYKFRNGSIYRH